MRQAAKTGLAGLAMMTVGMAAAPALADCPGRTPVGATGSSVAAPQASPGNCTTAYDGGMVTLSGHAIGTVTDSFTMTQYQYDDRGDVLAQTTADGVTTYFGHAGPVTEVTDPSGHVVRFTYDAQHDVMQVTDPTGAHTSYSYDAQDRVIGITDAMGHASTYGYDTNSGLMSTTTDGNNVMSTYTYDGLDRVTMSTMGGDTTTYGYDTTTGDMTGTSDTLGRTTSYQYDAMNRVVSETDIFGGSTETTTYAYDAMGDVTSLVDPLGQTTHSTYDAMGDLTSQLDGFGNLTKFTYDAVGNVTSETDQQGQTTTFQYDALNRLVGETGPDGGAYTFSPEGVPEPSAWALMILGLGALGLRLRSRRAWASAPRNGLFA